MTAVGVEPREWPSTAFRDKYQEAIRDLVNPDVPDPAESEPYDPLTDDPVVAPPRYGAPQRFGHPVPEDPKSPDGFYAALNVEPRHRTVAALGFEVVRRDQESLMAAAWDYAASLPNVNQRLNRAALLLRAAVARRVKFQTLPVDARVEISSPAAGTIGSPLGGSLRQTLIAAAVPQGVTTATFRRLGRPGGPLSPKAVAGAESSTASSGVVTASVVTSGAAQLLGFRNGALPRGIDVAIVAGERSVSPTGGVPVGRRRRRAGARTAARPIVGEPVDRDVIITAPTTPTTVTIARPADGPTLALATTVPAAPGPSVWAAAATAVDPEVGVQRLVNARMVGVATSAPVPSRLRAVPVFSDPMYERLRALSPDYVVPGIGLVPDNTVGVLEVNPEFVESFLLGLNHEMSREFRWREYPAQLWHTWFHQFWDTGPGGPPDLATDIDTWRAATRLGNNVAGGERLVLLVKGDLVRRYPDVNVYAVRASMVDGVRVAPPGSEIRPPAFVGQLQPGVQFYGFDLEQEEANGDDGGDGWFFALEEQPRWSPLRVRRRAAVAGRPRCAGGPGAFVVVDDDLGAPRQRRRRPGPDDRRCARPDGAPGPQHRARRRRRLVGRARRGDGPHHVAYPHTSPDPRVGAAARRPRNHRTAPPMTDTRPTPNRRTIDPNPDDPIDMDPFPPRLPGLVEQVAAPLVPAPDIDRDEPLDPAVTVDVPLLLLPVRVETRFTADRQHLRIRIYPDQVHLDTTAMAPTAAELDHARTFWTMRHADPRGATQTFRWLVDRVGSRRAGYVARLTKPTKTPDGLTFPDITPQQVDTPARVRLMPDHFIAIGWHGDDEIFRVPGKPVSDDLVASPDPTRAGVTLDATGLRTDPAMAWMFDYDVAVERGMAITVDLAGKTGLTEVTTLLVLGVDATDPDTGAKNLAELLAAHQRAGDFAFVPQGTPTNNTDSVAAGYTRHERELADLERRELGDPVRTQLVWDNAERFAMALGLADATPYRYAAFGDDTELLRSRAMRAALFEATLGTFIRLALPLHGGGQLVQRVVPPLRKWFIDEVTAGAPIPSIRIRNQPYGIVPIAAPAAPGPADTTAVKVRDVVELLRNEWRFAAGGVVRLDHDAVDATGTFTPDDIGIVLAGEPHPAEFAARGAEEFDTVETIGTVRPHRHVPHRRRRRGRVLRVAGRLPRRVGRGTGRAASRTLRTCTRSWRRSSPSIRRPPASRASSPAGWRSVTTSPCSPSPRRPTVERMQSWRYLPEAVAALPVIDDQLVQLWAHERRQRPVRWLGIEPYAGVLGENNNQLLLTRFDASTKAVQRALVEERDAPANGRAAGYLSALQTHRAGGTDPYPVPDDAALLHQLVGQTVHHLRTADIPCLATLAAVDAPTLEWHARDARSGHPPARRLGHERGDPAVARAALPRTRPRSGLAGRLARPTRRGPRRRLRVGHRPPPAGLDRQPGLRAHAVDGPRRDGGDPALGVDGPRRRFGAGPRRRGHPERPRPNVGVAARRCAQRTSARRPARLPPRALPPRHRPRRPHRPAPSLRRRRPGPPRHHCRGPGRRARSARAVAGRHALRRVAGGRPPGPDRCAEGGRRLRTGAARARLRRDRRRDAVRGHPPAGRGQHRPRRCRHLLDGRRRPRPARTGRPAHPDRGADHRSPGDGADRRRRRCGPIGGRPGSAARSRRSSSRGWRTCCRHRPPSASGSAPATTRCPGGSTASACRPSTSSPSPATIPAPSAPGWPSSSGWPIPITPLATIDAGDPAGAPASLAELQLLAIEIRRMVEAARPAVAADLLPSALVDPAAVPTPSKGGGQSVDVAGTVLEHLKWAIDHPDEARPQLARLGIVAPADDTAALVELTRTRAAAMIEIRRSGGSGDDAVAAGLGRGVPLLTPFRGGPDAVTLGNDLADAAHIDDWIDLVAPVRPGVGRWTTVQLLGELLDVPTTTVLVTGQLPLQPGDPWAATAAPPRRLGAAPW